MSVITLNDVVLAKQALMQAELRTPRYVIHRGPATPELEQEAAELDAVLIRMDTLPGLKGPKKYQGQRSGIVPVVAAVMGASSISDNHATTGNGQWTTIITGTVGRLDSLRIIETEPGPGDSWWGKDQKLRISRGQKYQRQRSGKAPRKW